MVPKELIYYLQEHGTKYIPSRRLTDIPSGKVGDCFDHCLISVLTRSHLKYVEGIAINPLDRTEWILHAWLSDGLYAYDPTWLAKDKEGKEIPVPTLYIGIPFETRAVAKFVSETEYKSIMANGWRCRMLADEMLPARFPHDVMRKLNESH